MGADSTVASATKEKEESWPSADGRQESNERHLLHTAHRLPMESAPAQPGCTKYSA
jgi:hypothetical protein